jgi:hypothetical protein
MDLRDAVFLVLFNKSTHWWTISAVLHEVQTIMLKDATEQDVLVQLAFFVKQGVVESRIEGDERLYKYCIPKKR